ncbi:MAG: threonine/serine exporter family protein [Myxococcaceae bacterium]
MGATQETLAKSETPTQANLALVLALAQALHRYGTPAHRLEALMYRVCDRLGLEARFVATPTAMFGSFGPITELRTTVFGAEPSGGRIGSLALGPELGVFIGALLLGMGSNALARLLQRPSVVTLVPGLMLLVPGSIGFRSLFSLLEQNVVAGVGAAFSMLMVAVSLVAGLLTANAVLPSRGAL